MDAIVFLRELKRMCNSIECSECIIDEKSVEKGCSCLKYAEDFPKETVDGVEQWSKEHPVITNGAKFEEVFGRTYMSLPSFVGEWLEQEYKEPKGEE